MIPYIKQITFRLYKVKVHTYSPIKCYLNRSHMACFELAVFKTKKKPYLFHPNRSNYEIIRKQTSVYRLQCLPCAKFSENCRCNR